MPKKKHVYTADQLRDGSVTVTEVNGKWRATISYYRPDDGGTPRREQISRTFAKDEAKGKRAALRAGKQWRDQLVHQAELLDAGRDEMANHNWTVGEYASNWLEKQRRHIEGTTYRGYVSVLNRIVLQFGETPISELSAEAVGDWHERLVKEGSADSTVKKNHNMLKQVLDQAVEDGLVTANVCSRRAAKPPKARRKAPVNMLTKESYADLLAYLDNAPESQFTMAALLAAQTGMRPSEVCGLHWRDVHFSTDDSVGSISIRSAVVYGDGGLYEKEPKSSAGLRDIPLQDLLEKHLRSWRSEQWQARLAMVETTAEEFGALYVVGKIDGEPYSPVVFSRYFKTLAELLGLQGESRPPVLYDLRHTFATLLVHNQTNMKAAQQLMGHSSITMTYDTYAAADNDAAAKAVMAINSISEDVLAEANQRHAEEDAAHGHVVAFPTGTEG